MKRISPTEAQALLQEGWTYVDVRSQPEFEQGHPKGAVNIPLMNAGPGGMTPNPDFLASVQKRFPVTSKLVVGCQAGGRSLRAATMLEGAGYSELVDQRCGWGGSNGEAGWAASGLPTETGKGG
jgi:rhodanese-related sulfurtransferase